MTKPTWIIRKMKANGQYSEGVVLSIKQPSEGFTRGEGYNHYLISYDDALSLADELVKAIK